MAQKIQQLQKQLDQEQKEWDEIQKEKMEYLEDLKKQQGMPSPSN